VAAVAVVVAILCVCDVIINKENTFSNCVSCYESTYQHKKRVQRFDQLSLWWMAV
jgi:hypothetical protein